jgi:hypothetical protein
MGLKVLKTSIKVTHRFSVYHFIFVAIEQETIHLKPEMAKIHIADLFFHAEITRAAGRKASDQWLSDQVAARPRRSSISSSAPDSPRSYASYIDHSKSACNESDRSQSPSNICQAGRTELDCVLLSDIDICEELGDLVGLLFTDAAHTVLRQVKCRRNSL